MSSATLSGSTGLRQRSISRVSASALSLAVALTVAQCRAGTTYVLETGSTPLTDAQRAELRATYGNTDIQVYGTDVGGGVINGSTLLKGVISNGVTYFRVAGDLNLNATDAIVTIGSNPIRIDVAANANIALGARISASSSGTLTGAGAGQGGTGGQRPDVARATLPGQGGSKSAASFRTIGNAQDGVTGGPGGDTRVIAPDALTSYGGQVGQAGAGISPFLGTAAGGATQDGGVRSANPPQGGEGGIRGRGGDPNGFGAGNGQPGTNGIDGFIGNSGAGGLGNVSLGSNVNLHGGGGGGGGANGGDGMAGGGGGQGGSGGSGTSPPAPPILIGDYPTAYGGAGLTGNPGGRGGIGAAQGGAGGTGGGGVGLYINGRLNLNGAIVADATAGQDAAYDLAEQGQRQIVPNSDSKDVGGTSTTGHRGGDGGVVGRGGAAALGGIGGGGGGGAGGSVFIVASAYNRAASAIVRANAGAGGTSGNGTSVTDPFTGITTVYPPTNVAPTGAAGDVRANAFGGTGAATDTSIGKAGTNNPFRIDSYGNTNTPNFYSGGIEGGVAAFGRLTNDDGTINTTVARVIRPAATQTNTRAFVALGSGTVSPELAGRYQTLIYVSTDNDVKSPGFRIYGNVNPHLPFYIPNPNNPPLNVTNPTAQPLVSSGWQRDPRFVAGATGDIVIGTLGGNQVYETLVETARANTYNTLVGQFTPYTNVRTYSVTYNSNNAPPTLYLNDTGLAAITVRTPTATSTTSYTQDFVNTDATSVLQTALRAGTARNLTTSVVNVGNATSLMSGSVTLDDTPLRTFSNLSGGQGIGVTIPLTAAAGTAGTAQAHQFSLATDAGGIFGDLGVQVVGPDFRVPAAGSATFDTGARGSLFLSLSNQSTYTAIPALSNLDILDLTFTGDAAALFELSPFALDSTLLTAGQGERLAVGFTGTLVPGTYTATLHLLTDQNTELGRAGQSFDVPLSVTVVPEPMGISVLALAGCILLTRQRRSCGPVGTPRSA